MAGPFEDAVAKFANTIIRYRGRDRCGRETPAAIRWLPHHSARSSDYSLMADPDTKKVYAAKPDGKNIDAATAPRASMPYSAAAVRLTNRLPATVEAALRLLTLLSPDPVNRSRRTSVLRDPRRDHAAGDPTARCRRKPNKAGQLALPRRARHPVFKERRHRLQSWTPSIPSRRGAIRKALSAV